MKLTEEEVEQLYGEIENQGFGYWVQHYGYEGSNEELKNLCKIAKEGLNNLKKFLEEQGVLG